MNRTTDPNGPKAARVGVEEKLQNLFACPGPFVSVYLQTRPLWGDAVAEMWDRWKRFRSELEADGAGTKALEAVDGRLSQPLPEDTAGIAVLAAADGTTVIEHALDPPGHDLVVVDHLPRVAPVLEWRQRRIPHLVVTVDEDGADIATLALEHHTRLEAVDGDLMSLVPQVKERVRDVGAQLVVVAGPAFLTRRLAAELVGAVPIQCRVVAEPDPPNTDELADATVRHAADVAARNTVGYLRELRYLTAHDSAVDGTADTVAALRQGGADVLLIHDDPSDQRRIWIGPRPLDLSLEKRSGWTASARLVDAAVRAALGSGAIVHVIPSTGPRGPDDDAAVLHRSTTASSRLAS